ncbi:cation:proton antiporter [Fructilactobacillus vespulae]|uniref:cation:proton antiporter n=1 Tax=Fructilactobacillus vespulae TaxID=1249630 RepID=UPI0039B5A826
MNYLFIICLILGSAIVGGLVFQRIGLPSVVGQIVAGIIIGPAILNFVKIDNLISTGSTIGIILLMFLAGLECDFDQVKKFMKPSFVVASLGVLAPLVLFFALGMALQQGIRDSILWGVIFSATSVSISVAVLQEYNKLNTVAGSVILGAAVVDDIISIILLSIFTSTFGKGGISIFSMILLQLLYLAFVLVMVRYLVPHIFKFIVRFNDTILLVVVSLIICFSMAYIAELASLSEVLGAFFAGVAISLTNVGEKIEKNINVIGYSFFIPIFFVSVGLELELVTSFKSYFLVFIITGLAVITKWIACGIGAKIFRFSWQDANIVGAGMVSRGEMALIVTQVAISNSLISKSLYSELVLAIILTTIISPIMLKSFIKNK